jgi:hypothetical protein
VPTLAYALPLGVVCGVVALASVLFLAIGHQLGARTHALFSRLGGRNAGLLGTPVVGGALLGMLAKVREAAPVESGVASDGQRGAWLAEWHRRPLSETRGVLRC